MSPCLTRRWVTRGASYRQARKKHRRGGGCGCGTDVLVQNSGLAAGAARFGGNFGSLEPPHPMAEMDASILR